MFQFDFVSLSYNHRGDYYKKYSSFRLIMIKVQDVVKHFGGVAAVDGVSMEIKQGTITGLIGPNGAGKSTLFNLIAGNLNPESVYIWMERMLLDLNRTCFFPRDC